MRGSTSGSRRGGWRRWAPGWPRAGPPGSTRRAPLSAPASSSPTPTRPSPAARTTGRRPPAPALGVGAVRNGGRVSALLGLRGAPGGGEAVVVERDILLAELTGGRVHIAHPSAAASLEAVRRGKARGVSVTAEVTPHHLLLTDQAVKDAESDTSTKINPPLRGEADRRALLERRQDGTIDWITTD